MKKRRKHARIELSMSERMERFFSPCVRLVWKPHALRGYWGPGDAQSRKLATEFLGEMGERNWTRVYPERYEEFLAVASKYGYCVETVGGPWEEEEEISSTQPRRSEQK